MANIMDYLDWRGDISFYQDPFNEVDNLICAMLSYVDFAGVLTDLEPGESMSIQEASKIFFALHTEEELLALDTFTKMTPFLLPRLADSERYKELRFGNYVDIYSEHEEEQMSALTCYLPDGTIYAAFRGTDNTVIGWKEDFNLSFLSETSGQREAADYLTAHFSRRGPKIRVGGHSKGGNFAVFAASFCSEAVKDRILEVWSNDGPGFLDSVLERSEYQEMLPKIKSIIPAYSIFGLLLGSAYTHKVISSSQKGVFQHDGMSWEVKGNRFVEAPGITQDSIFMEKTIKNWVAGFDLDERAEFVNLVYELISTSGAKTMTELKEERMKNALGIMKAYGQLDAENQKMVKNTLMALVKSGADVLTDESVVGSKKPHMSESLANLSMQMTAAAIDKLGLTDRVLKTGKGKEEAAQQSEKSEETDNV